MKYLFFSILSLIIFGSTSCKKGIGVSSDITKQLIGEWKLLNTDADGALIEFSDFFVEFTKNGKYLRKQGNEDLLPVNYKIVNRESNSSKNKTEQFRLKSSKNATYQTIEFIGSDTLVLKLECSDCSSSTFFKRK